MKGFVKSVLRRLPGSSRIDRYLLRRYTGCDHPEFVLRGSFHSPLPDLRDVEANSAEWFNKEVDVGPSIRLRSTEQAALLQELHGYYAEFNWPEHPAPGFRYYLNNSYFCHADAISLYSMFRHFRPRRVIEIGSGF